MQQELMQYIQTGRSSVEGWFAEADAWLFGLCNDLHRTAEVNGDILEIGVYLGASAIELGYCLDSEERLVVCDLFDDPAPTQENAREFDRFYTRQLRRTAAESIAFARQAFENNYLRFHPTLPTILQGNSAVVLADLPEHTFRIVHVDGSHSYELVKEDIRTAKRLLNDDGILILDDLYTHHTPGVSAAIWEAIATDLIPLATTNKMYATWSTGGEITAANIRKLIEQRSEVRVVDHHNVRGYDILEVESWNPDSWAKRIARNVIPPGFEKLARRGLMRARKKAASGNAVAHTPRRGSPPLLSTSPVR